MVWMLGSNKYYIFPVTALSFNNTHLAEYLNLHI